MASGSQRTAGECGTVKTHAGRILLFAALSMLLISAAWVRLALISYRSLDFYPRPDAVEYAAAAVSLVEGRGLTLPIGGGIYPARYPCGFPLILGAGMLLGLPEDRLVLVPLFLGLLSIVLVWCLSRLVGGGPWAALLAAALVAASPLHVHICTRVISEAASLVVLIAGLIVCVPAKAGAASRARVKVLPLAAGLAAGFAFATRLANGVVLPVFLFMVVWGARRSGRRIPAALLLFFLGAAVSVLPQLVFNQLNFGDPLVAGYSFWSERYRHLERAFSASYVVHPGDPKYGNVYYYLQHAAGMYFDRNFLRLYSLPAAMLAVVGLYGLRRATERWYHLCGMAFCLGTLAMLMLYVGQTSRLLVAILPWIAVWAGEGAQRLWKRPRGAPFRRTCRLAVLLLAAAAIFPYFGWTMQQAWVEQSGAGDQTSMGAWLRERIPPRALVISNISPLATHIWLEGKDGREVVPLSTDDPDYLRFIFGREFRGQGPPLPQAAFVEAGGGGDPIRPLIGDDGPDPGREEELRSAFVSRRPVFAVLGAPHPLGRDSLRLFRIRYRMRNTGRLRDVRVFRVAGERNPATANSAVPSVVPGPGRSAETEGLR